MPLSICQKLKIKEGMSLLTLHAPQNFEEYLQPVPAGVMISPKQKKYDQIHWFITNKAQLDKEVEQVMGMLKENIVCWIYYPKLSGKIKTDLTRDKGWESLLKHTELQWLSMISFDETWTASGFRLKTDADIKKAAAPKEREIFKYIDAVKKTIQLPDDLASALSENSSASTLFDKLSFTNRKEYVEWIVTAKREETRKQRVEGTIERLLKGWKNPANR